MLAIILQAGAGRGKQAHICQGNSAVLVRWELVGLSCRSFNEIDVAGELGTLGVSRHGQIWRRRGKSDCQRKNEEKTVREGGGEFQSRESKPFKRE